MHKNKNYNYNEIPSIIVRNKRILSDLIERFSIKRTTEQLLTQFERVLVSDDEKTKRLRLLGVEHYFKENDDGGLNTENIEKKQVQLFVLKKREIENMQKDEIENIKFILKCFVDFYNQIRSANDILSTEDKTINFHYVLSSV